MATGKEKDKEPAPQKVKAKAKPKEEKGVLETAAEAIGSALGTIAKTTGIADSGKQVSKKIGKLQKKNKQRVPRKAKKKAAKALGSPARK
jgi:hypothetical protein